VHSAARPAARSSQREGRAHARRAVLARGNEPSQRSHGPRRSQGVPVRGQPSGATFEHDAWRVGWPARDAPPTASRSRPLGVLGCPARDQATSLTSRARPTRSDAAAASPPAGTCGSVSSSTRPARSGRQVTSTWASPPAGRRAARSGRRRSSSTSTPAGERGGGPVTSTALHTSAICGRWEGCARQRGGTLPPQAPTPPLGGLCCQDERCRRASRAGGGAGRARGRAPSPAPRSARSPP
jgi:hypothetical protein